MSQSHRQDLRRQSKKGFRALTELLRLALLVETDLWNYQTKSWISSIAAADIDSDGDIELLLGSYDGYVKALTSVGTLKWKTHLNGERISVISVLPVTERVKLAKNNARIMVGTRSGNLFVLSEEGHIVPGWTYKTDGMISQISHRSSPENVIISSDLWVSVLDGADGLLYQERYQIASAIRNVFVNDIDDDGLEEILVGSDDQNLYILDYRGKCIQKIFMSAQIYTFFAVDMGSHKEIRVLAGSDRKALSVWAITRNRRQLWHAKKVWERKLGNCVRPTCIVDIDNDGFLEILVGCEDGYLYIIDLQGTLLWKHLFNSGIYSIFASDINSDGRIEICVGTEDNGVYAFHVELVNNLYRRITGAYEAILKRGFTELDIIGILSSKELQIFKEVIETGQKQAYPQPRPAMEMQKALNLCQEHHYEEAISVFLRLRSQEIQHCWKNPIIVEGYIWTQCVGRLSSGTQKTLIVGTDSGTICALDCEGDNGRLLWKRNMPARVVMIQAGALKPAKPDVILALLSNNQVMMLDHCGNVIQEHTLKDVARCICLVGNRSNERFIDEIVIGSANGKISIWDVEFQQELSTIFAPEGVNVVNICDIDGNGFTEVVSSSIKNQVYAHDRQNNELWRFEMQDRALSIFAEDIDKDGKIEIIIGSADRNIYVLDAKGRLKWRYRTLRGVLAVDVCGIQWENNPDDGYERTKKILVSSADGYLSMLNATGDLIWRYKSDNRIRAIHAGGLTVDGNSEIAIASENQLELLQLVQENQLYEYIQLCWQELLDGQEDSRGFIMAFTHHVNEYIRAFALNKLAEQHERHSDDFELFQEVLRYDESLHVRKTLCHCIAVLYRASDRDPENARLALYLLHHLSSDSEQEIRLAVVNILPCIAEINRDVCFEYLASFTRNSDVWLRRTVVRQLDKLVNYYPEHAFDLLQKTAVDMDEWVRQETARALAHYFDVCTEYVLDRLYTLFLHARVGVPMLQLVTQSVTNPGVHQMLNDLVSLFSDLSAENAIDILSRTVESLHGATAQGVVHEQGMAQIYGQLCQLLQARNIYDIEQWKGMLDLETIGTLPGLAQTKQFFEQLLPIVHTVRSYMRRETLGDRAASLIETIVQIEELQRKERDNERLRYGMMVSPEDQIFIFVLQHWHTLVIAELRRLRGHAELWPDLRTRSAWHEEEISVVLSITNVGRCPADNVVVQLDTSDDHDFTVIGHDQQVLAEISSHPSQVEFLIQPHAPIIRLTFTIHYEDAESIRKTLSFADRLELRTRQYGFKQIPNPYHSGTPVRNRKMFFGRGDDLVFLSENLSSTAGNRVVVLVGQRRSGKTSLLLQLAEYPSLISPHIPVFIDLQALSLSSSVGQFLTSIAWNISTTLKEKGIEALPPDTPNFIADPTRTFNIFLERVTHLLVERKLILLFDEFEVLNYMIEEGRLDRLLLSYLRSLMQHQQGINFLLAGTFQLKFLTDSYWSVFFNIAIHHQLTRLSQEVSVELITAPVAGYLEYDPFAIQKMLDLTGGMPYLIHIMCEMIIQHCNRSRRSYVRTTDIDAVTKSLLQRTSYFGWIWDQSSSLERFILSILAQNAEKRVGTLTDIQEEHDVQGIRYEREQVAQALKHLVENEIIETGIYDSQFTIPIGLLRAWLQTTQPPSRVVREELLGYRED